MSEGNIVKFGTTTGLTAGAVYVWNGTNWVAGRWRRRHHYEGTHGRGRWAQQPTDGLFDSRRGVPLARSRRGRRHPLRGYCDPRIFDGYATQRTGDFVRVAGYCLADNKVFFSPSQDWIEIA